jgi:CDP-glucose 4,6-dehydratase
MFNNFYNGKRVFVTGHTGFKGTWLTAWLQHLNAEVFGYSNSFTQYSWDKNPTIPFNDIRNYERLEKALKDFNPEIIFHLAAQPIVITSYLQPLETFSTNVTGTINLFEASKHLKSLKVIVNVTTDKVYKITGENRAYHEKDILEGYDPYSTSKVCSELITASYRKILSNVKIATARAGNVLGGGDCSDYRLIPDMVKAIIKDKALEIRNPKAIRPFQFILDCLQGYLLLGSSLTRTKFFDDAWNFGSDEVITVEELVKLFNKNWHTKKENFVLQNSEFKETEVLTLNSEKAKDCLNWHPIYNVSDTVEKTIDWYQEYLATMHDIRLYQIKQYEFALKAQKNRGLF